MSDSTTDTRATAYLFGELSTEEASRFEQELEASPKLQEEVAQLREALSAITDEFDGQSMGVSEATRQEIERAIDQAGVAPVPSSSNKRFVWLVVATAASVLILASLALPAVWQGGQEIDTTAMNTVTLQEQLAGEGQTTGVELREAVEERRILEEEALAHDAWVAETEVLNEQIASVELQIQAHKDKIESLSKQTKGFAGQGLSAQPLTASPSLEGKVEPSQLELLRETKSLSDSVQRLVELKKRIPQKPDGEVRAALRPVKPADPLAEPALPKLAESSDAEFGDGDEDALMLMVTPRVMVGDEEEPLARQFSLPGKKSPRDGAEMMMMDEMMMEEEEMMGMGGLGMEAEHAVADFAMMGDMDDAYFETDGLIGAEDEFAMAVENGDAEMLADLMGVETPHEEGRSRDRFEPIDDNPFMTAARQSLSTFSIDVDTAAYAKVRSFLMQQHTKVRPSAVRIEELVNYFPYSYEPPKTDEHPFAATMDIAGCPWNEDHRLARIGIKGKVLDENRPPSNLVFLLDVSGSMDEPNKLPLVIEGMKMLTDQLSENDSVAIVVYAGSSGVVLDSARGDQKHIIHDALSRLKAGGSTNGGEGIVRAYDLARDHFIAGGTNRVILCTDGDFNVGVTGTDQLLEIVKKNAQGNIYLSVLGFGMGNHNDAMLEKVSNQGNGNYAFIDSRAEAQKVLVEEMGGTLVTIAKDVKIQIEFNPKEIKAYRLIGYENRVMAAQDFNDDTKDAGEIGAGHTVTALYELIPADSVSELSVPETDELLYQKKARLSKRAHSGEALTLKLRYKSPEALPGDKSTLLSVPVTDRGKSFDEMDDDFQFAAAVASFGMQLRQSPHQGDTSLAAVEEIASACLSQDPSGLRAEFVAMVQTAQTIYGQP